MQPFSEPARSLRAARVLLGVVAAACVLAYASQLFLGRWQNDEYRLFTTERQWGLGALPTRLSYSPRPFSEAILFVYGQFVLALHRPLITSFLALLWGGSVAGVFWAARSALTAPRTRSVTAAGLALVLFGFVLATNDVTETFYWPMAAAAYVPTGSGAAALLFLLAKPMTRVNQAFCALVLSIVAASSEVGAALTLGFAAAACVDLALRRTGPARRHLWWILPGLLSLAIFAVLVSVRVGLNELGASSHPVTGHFGAALVLSATHLVADALGGAAATGVGAAAVCLAAKLWFAASFAAVCRQAGCAVPRREHALLALALVMAAFFSLFAAFYHYGTACCERQATSRSWLIDLTLVIGVAALLGRAVPWESLLGSRGRLAWLPCVMLALSLWPVLLRTNAFRHDNQVHGLALESRVRTWRSGLRPSPDMKFYMPPDGADLLVRGTSQKLGTYSTVDAPEMVQAVGRFFGKKRITTCEPWQTEKSLLLDGQFIAACPPHGGPPDIVGHFGPR